MLDRLGKGLRAQYGTDYQLREKEKHYFDTFYDNKGILTVVKENDKRKLTTKDTEGRGRRNEAGKSSWSEKKSEQMMLAGMQNSGFSGTISGS